MSKEPKKPDEGSTESDPTASISGDLGRLLEERERLDELLRNKFTKNITVMFTDMKGSTALAENEGNFAARFLIEQHNKIVFPIIQQNRGHLVKTMGDGTLSYFDAPRDAVLCGVQIQKSVAEFNGAKQPKVPIQVRIGIHTGQGLVEKKDIYGDVVNVASRIETQGNPGEVYLSEDTYNALADKDEIYCSFQKLASLKGKKEPFRIFKAFWIPEEIAEDRKTPKTFTVEEKKKAATTSSMLTQSQMFKFQKSSKEVASEIKAIGPSIVIEVADRAKRIIHLNQPETVIGRAPDSDVVLDESYISRHHAKITMKDGKYWIEDLGSRIGTTINGEVVTKKELAFGDEISLGEMRITFVAPVDTHPRKEAPAEDEAAVTMAMTKKFKLVVLGPDKEIHEFPVTGEEKIIGRLEEAHIRLSDNLVSRRHAKIWEENGQIFIEDMGSNNGTLVDGRIIPKAEPVLLQEKALITICSYRLVLLNLFDKPAPEMFTSTTPTTSLVSKVKGLWESKDPK